MAENKPNINKIWASSMILLILLLALGSIMWFISVGGELDNFVYILFSILGLLIILALIKVVIIWGSKKAFEPNYHVLFILGAIYLPVGYFLQSALFFLTGLAFLAVGYSNKRLWKSQKISGINIANKNLFVSFSLTLSLIILVGLAYYTAS